MTHTVATHGWGDVLYVDVYARSRDVTLGDLNPDLRRAVAVVGRPAVRARHDQVAPQQLSRASVGRDGGEDVELGGAPRRPAGREQAEQSGQDQEDDQARERHDDVGDALRLSDQANAIPSPVPTMMPMMAPKTERMTDSERIIPRICRRFMPTARSSPISCVRSNTESMRVLTIPIRAMITARRSNT